MSYNNKPIEYDVLSKCSTLPSIKMDKTTYRPVKENSNEKSNESEENVNAATTITGLGIQNDSLLRIVPMERKYGGWSTEHFHPDFKMSTDDTNGFLILFQGMAKECIAIAISPQPKYQLGTKTYAIHIGASGNQYTIIRRHLTNDKTVEASYFTPQVCSLKKYQSYWIYYQPKECKIYVGIGNMPGKKCIAKLDDSSDSLFDRGSSTYYAGFGNSTLYKYNTGQKQHNDSQYVKIRRISAFSTPLQSEEVRPFQNIHEKNNTTTETVTAIIINDDLKKEYNDQYEKAKARAEKFNIEFKGLPPIEEYFMNKEYNSQYEKARIRAEKFNVEFKGLPPIKEYFKNTCNDLNANARATKRQMKRSFADDMQDFKKRAHALKKRKTTKEHMHNSNKSIQNNNKRRNPKKKNYQQDNAVDEEELLHSELKSKRASNNKEATKENEISEDDLVGLNAGLKSKR